MKRSTIIEQDLQYILADTNIDWHAFEGCTFLITGANGFLPAYLVETLLYANETRFKNKVKIIGLVRNTEKALMRFPYYSGRDDLELIEQDVACPINVNSKVDYIIHAASHASPRFFFSDPVGTIGANAIGTNNLLQLAQEKKTRNFLFFSTGEVCGNIFDTKSVVSENDYGVVDPLSVRSSYAEGKRAGEALCAAYSHQYGLRTCIVRPAHTYGPGFSLDDGRAFASFVAAVTTGKNIVLNSDGSACRSFIYLADATRAYFTILQKGNTAEAYNVGNSYETSMRDLAQTIIDASGNKNLKVEFNISPTASVSSASKHGLLSIDKIKALGWAPKIKEAQGFAQTIAYFKGLAS